MKRVNHGAGEYVPAVIAIPLTGLRAFGRGKKLAVDPWKLMSTFPGNTYRST